MDSFLSGIVSNTAFAGTLALVAFGVQKIGRSPQLAHALWLLVLIKLVTPPVFHVALPDGFRLSVSRVADRSSSGNSDRIPTPIVAERMPAATTLSPIVARRDDQQIPAASESTAESAAITVLTTSPALSRASTIESLAHLLAGRWQVLLCTVWAGGVLIGLAILCRRLGQFRRLLIEAVDGDATLDDDVRAFARRLGLRSCPSIRVLDAHVSPLVFAGWRHLILLIPARLLSGLDRQQLHSVLVHELAHIRRRDHLTRWFEIFVRGIFWWHPLAWWASRQLRQAEEECCDAWVVWALPDGRRSYGKALLWTIEFLAERRVHPVVAGTALGGSHVKRRIETIMKQQLNHRMSWVALAGLVVLSASVLPVGAQTRDKTSQAAPEKRDLEARIEQLERLVQDLSQTVKRPATDSDKAEQDKGNRPADSAVKNVRLTLLQQPQPYLLDFDTWQLGLLHAPETAEDRQLKETLVALNKQSWDAASKGDWTVDDKLLDKDYFGLYVSSSGVVRTDKAADIAGVKRRRYFDVNRRDEVAKRIGKDSAILTYLYSCKVEEAGRLQTYRDHQATQVWTQKDDNWVLSFSQDFILPGGE